MGMAPPMSLSPFRARRFKLRLRISGAGRNHLQILRCDHSELVPAAIVCGPQVFEFFAELSRRGFIQRSERAISRSIVLAEELHNISWREGVGGDVVTLL